MAAVSTRNIVKKFGEVPAVNGISLDVPNGEFMVLLGPSGCGKTTYLRIICGLEQQTSGDLLIGGDIVNDMPPRARGVAMMFQSYGLYPHFTVRNNIAFPLKTQSVPRAEIDKKVAWASQLLGIGHLLDRKPRQLSGGERQRVALARALIKRPKLLLLDEPLGALDRKLREHTQFELINIQQQLGVTFVVVTHDQEEAMTLATRIGVMNHGKIVQIGAPRQIYEFPATRFVADFIGSVNLFDGRLIEDEPDYVRVRCEQLPASVLVDHGISAPPDAPLWVAVRPEKINLSRQAPPDPDNWAKGVIREIAYLGDLSVFLVRLESGREVRATLANNTRKPEEQFSRDMPVYLSWDASSPVIGST